MVNRCKLLTQSLITLTLLFAVSTTALASANLLVTPSRVVFEERERTAQITLLNTGDETGSFRISFIRQQMTENGQFVTAKNDEPGRYSDPMVRYSPRQITLPPGQPQVVRLMLRKPRDLEDGEYRSHMLFQSIPQAGKSSLESAVKSGQKGISVEIIPVVGISIPIIVRQGKLESTIRLDNAGLIPPTQTVPQTQMMVDMHRTGTKSVYGDFRVLYTPSGGGDPLTVGLVNGVAVYTPNELRRFTMPLNIPQDVSLQGGWLRVIFLESGKDEKTGLLAETEIALP